MYVITVTFEIAIEHATPFRVAMMKQAENSLRLEQGCHQFDVCFDPEHGGRCFLYEKYGDRAAFDAHLASDHFKAFDATVSPWVVSKQVQAWIEEQAS